MAISAERIIKANHVGMVLVLEHPTKEMASVGCMVALMALADHLFTAGIQ